MREIIFRGKRVDNGEWANGNYVEKIHYYEGSELPCIQVVMQKPSVSDRFVPCFETELVEVDPETVGQYTGLKDKNGKMIFEGDVLFGWKGYSIAYAGDNDESLEMIAGWYIQRDNFETYTELVCSDEYEVIGTIHDQKEDV